LNTREVGGIRASRGSRCDSSSENGWIFASHKETHGEQDLVSKRNRPLFFASIAITLAILNVVLFKLAPLGLDLSDVGVSYLSKKSSKPGMSFYTSRHDLPNRPEPRLVTAEDASRSTAITLPYASRVTRKISSHPTLSGTTEGLLLLNYIQQFSPSDGEQLDYIFQVAMDAKEQLANESLMASEALSRKRADLQDLLDQATGAAYNRENHSRQMFEIFGLYLDKLREQGTLDRELAIQLETTEGLEAQQEFAKADRLSGTPSLEDEKINLKSLQVKLSGVQTELQNLEFQLSDLFGEVPEQVGLRFHEQLLDYKKDLETFTDQDIAVERFEHILAAAQYIDFNAI
jgi:hypothetical protein